MLVLANKKDLKDAMTVGELTAALQLTGIKVGSWQLAIDIKHVRCFTRACTRPGRSERYAAWICP